MISLSFKKFLHILMHSHTHTQHNTYWQTLTKNTLTRHSLATNQTTKCREIYSIRIICVCPKSKHSRGGDATWAACESANSYANVTPSSPPYTSPLPPSWHPLSLVLLYLPRFCINENKSSRNSLRLGSSLIS